MSESASGKPPSRAEALFEEYLRRRDGGEALEFEEFLRGHPSLETDLRRLERNWQRVRGIMGRLAGGDTDDLARKSEPRLPPGEMHERLKDRRLPYERYRIEGEIARGGMGKVVNAWDGDLRRHVAMKVVLDEEKNGAADNSGRVRRLARFLEEAQITGQLDHPGIVPVHELGLDAEGRLYFTLKLVRGRDLRAIFGLVRTGAEGWNQTRALGVLLRVCEAMAFAHERGVIHRDLKPANIMVGRHGETYVMDWGLARVLGEEDPRDLRVATSTPSASHVGSDRYDASHETPGSPLLTVDGEVIGTPQYMPPEQAQGELERIGPASDVYALGAMLYELLAGKAPYLAGSGRVSPQAVWRWVIDGPPTPIGKLALKQPAELIAICEKAMSRRIEKRYPDMSELAEDLRAYLEHRVVRAYRTGALVELKKWIERNKIAAALSILLALVIAGAGYVSAGLERARQRERLERLARAHVEDAERSWPIDPSSVPAMKAWLDEAGAMVRSLPGLESELADLRSKGHELDESEWQDLREKSPLRQAMQNEDYYIRIFPARIEEARKILEAGGGDENGISQAKERKLVFERELPLAKERKEELNRQFRRGRGWRFDDPDEAAREMRLAGLVADLADLARPEVGWIARVQKNLDQARHLEEQTIDAMQSKWAEARASIADRSDCPDYDGLKLEPQIGLVPLQRDRESGLWEFWMPVSGAKPELVEKRDGTTEWRVEPETGIVLVLIPGGEATIGAQKADRYAMPVDVHHVRLDAFFLSKYELTQEQWERLGGGRPSTFPAGHAYKAGPPITATHPVESINWETTRRRLALWNLEIPTEAQWEYAARARGTQPLGEAEDLKAYDKMLEDRESTEGLETPLYRINCADLSYHDGSGQTEFLNYEPNHRDGWVLHGPVDHMERNLWGLYGTLGNVSEWTRDWTDATGGAGSSPGPGDYPSGTGEAQIEYAQMHTYRGGNFLFTGPMLRLAERFTVVLDAAQENLGVRPSRPILPAASHE
jgi:serine/threonine protein kinase/formylglycine-generating enzyme required for sulfatase activity